MVRLNKRVLFFSFFLQLQHIQRGLEGTDLYAKKAAYLALAAVVEGCSDFIRTKHLESFLQCVCKGITDEVAIVRDAALFTLGQLSEYLQVSLYQVLVPDHRGIPLHPCLTPSCVRCSYISFISVVCL
jgi:hypothetical protein